MKSLRGAWSWVTIAALFLLPSVALSEVSVQLDSHGNFKRTWRAWRQRRINIRDVQTAVEGSAP